MNPHRPVRPGWSCDNCGNAWPCAPTRTELRRVYGADTVGILVLMSGYLLEAVRDLDHLSTHDVTLRFVDWCRRPRAPHRARRGSYLASRSRAI